MYLKAYANHLPGVQVMATISLQYNGLSQIHSRAYIGEVLTRDQPFFNLLCYAAVLNILTYYAQYYAHVNELCLKSDCSIRVYSLVSKII